MQHHHLLQLFDIRLLLDKPAKLIALHLATPNVHRLRRSLPPRLEILRNCGIQIVGKISGVAIAAEFHNGKHPKRLVYRIDDVNVFDKSGGIRPNEILNPFQHKLRKARFTVIVVFQSWRGYDVEHAGFDGKGAGKVAAIVVADDLNLADFRKLIEYKSLIVEHLYGAAFVTKTFAHPCLKFTDSFFAAAVT